MSRGYPAINIYNNFLLVYIFICFSLLFNKLICSSVLIAFFLFVVFELIVSLSLYLQRKKRKAKSTG